MADFVPLAIWLARGAAAEPPPVEAASAPAAAPDTNERGNATLDEVARDLGFLRLAALEAFERMKTQLLESFATEVLGRELAIARSDVDALAARVLAQLPDLEPVALVLSPSDARFARSGIPVRVDATLAAGDFTVDVRDGSIESTFSFRLADALVRAAS